MDDFENNGFLGTQAFSKRNKLLEKYRKLFSFAEELNRFIISHVDFFPLQQCRKDLVIGSLFCKSITSYQSTILVLSYGLQNEAEVLLRSLMESTFILYACCNDEMYYKDYLKSHEAQRSRFEKNVISNNLAIDLRASFSTEEIDDAKNWFKQLKKYELKFSEISKKAGLEYYYLTQYFYLCITAHNLPRSLEHYIHLNENNEPLFEIIPKLDDDNVKLLIMSSSDLMLKIIDKLYEHKKLECNKRIKDFYEELNIL